VTTIPSQTRPRRAATVRHPALTDTNRERLQVGVGEEVDIYFDPPLGMSFPEEPLWWASAGGLERELSPTLLGFSGSAVKFTAPSNAATANVCVIVRDITLDKTFTVLEPSGVDHADIKTNSLGAYLRDYYGINAAGVGMYLRPYLGPTDVSFYRLTCMEVGEDASGVNGYFANTNAGWFTTNPPHYLNHSNWLANVPFPIHEDNSWDDGWDHAFWGNCSPPWTNGGFSWDIPGQWWIDGGQTNTMTSHWSQSFSIDASGTMAVQKFGHTATRNTNDVYTTIH